MNCQYCGQPISEDDRFCSACGAAVNAAAENAPEQVAVPGDAAVCEAPEATADSAAETPVSGAAADFAEQGAPQVPFTAPMPKKKSKKGLAISLTAVAAALAVLLGVLLVPRISTGSPKEQFQKVSKELAKNASVTAGQLLETNDNGAMFTMTMRPGGGLSDMAALGEEMDFITDLAVDITGKMKDGVCWMELAARIGEQKFFTAQVFEDLQEGRLVFSLPELSDQTLELNLLQYSEGLLDETEAELDELRIFSDQLTALSAAMPDSETMEECIYEYLCAVIDSIERVTREQTALEVEGVSQKCTLLTAEISEADLNGMALTVLKKAREDTRISDVVLAVAAAAGAQADAGDYTDWIDETIADIEDEKGSDETLATLRLWIDGREHIGFEIEAEDFTVRACGAESGGKWGVELVGVVEDETVFSVIGDGKASNGKYKGDLAVSVNGNEILTVALEDCFADDQGNVSCQLLLEPSRGLFTLLEENGTELDSATRMTVSALGLRYTAEGKQQEGVKGEMALLYGGEEILVLEIEEKLGKVEITVPEQGDTADIEQWAASLDTGRLMEALEAAGIPLGLFTGAAVA